MQWDDQSRNHASIPDISKGCFLSAKVFKVIFHTNEEKQKFSPKIKRPEQKPESSPLISTIIIRGVINSTSPHAFVACTRTLAVRTPSIKVTCGLPCSRDTSFHSSQPSNGPCAFLLPVLMLTYNRLWLMRFILTMKRLVSSLTFTLIPRCVTWNARQDTLWAQAL